MACIRVGGHCSFTLCPPAFFHGHYVVTKNQLLCFAVSSAVARVTEVTGTSRKCGSTKINSTFDIKTEILRLQIMLYFNNFAFMPGKQTYKAGSVS